MFGFHPVNLAFRLVLELVALIGIGVGAYTLADGSLAWMLALGLPLVAAVCWGLFNVPGDRSRSGQAPVPVAGWIRLLVELAVFGSAVVLVARVSPVYATALGVGVVVHNLFSLDRIRWLVIE